MGYSRGQVLLHWAIAALVILEWWTAATAGPAIAAWREGVSVELLAAHPLAVLHLAGGLALFVLVLALARSRSGRWAGSRSADDPPLLATLEWLTRVSLYLTLLAVPVLGLAFVLFDGLGGSLHARLAILLGGLVALHLGAVAWRTLVLRDGSILRIVQGEKPRIPQI